MKLWKKGLAVVSATALAASIPLYSVAAGSVTVSGTIWPKAGISLNYDGVDFAGTLGGVVTTTHKKGTESVATPTVTIRYKTGYNVNVKSESFTGTTAEAGLIALDPKRIKVNNISLDADGENILSKSAQDNSAKIEPQDLSFSLDLTEAGFTDSAEISALSSETDLSGIITISFNEL